MIKLGVTGATGRMGTAIIQRSLEDKVFKLCAAFELAGHPAIGQRTGDVFVEYAEKTAVKKLDVLIDFTTPEATLAHLKYASAAGTAMVIGTTGFEPKDVKKIQTASKKIPVVFAPNMSIGANLLFDLAAKAARLMDDTYDIEVIEAHHRYKKDAPSGTAKLLAERIAAAKHWDLDKKAVYGRKGLTGQRPSDQIGIHVVRAGEIIGFHTALFAGPGETVELTHRASSRDAFAKGALAAAKFLQRKRKGLFGMSDVLGL